MRPPSALLIVDSNILLSIALSVKNSHTIQAVRHVRDLAITEDCLVEVKRVLTKLTENLRSRPNLEDALQTTTIIARDDYGPALNAAKQFLRDAPPSRNGSMEDAHILACAWIFNADIWSHDRDFAGCGWPVWSTTNLIAALDA